MCDVSEPKADRNENYELSEPQADWYANEPVKMSEPKADWNVCV